MDEGCYRINRNLLLGVPGFDRQRVELPPMGICASWVTSRLKETVGSFAKTQRLGTVVTEALFILDPVRNLRRRPDPAFVSAQKWPLERPIPEAARFASPENAPVEGLLLAAGSSLVPASQLRA
jgi:hypothetical protein